MKHQLFGLVSVTALLGVGVWVFCPEPDLQADLSFGQAVQDRQGQLLRLSLARDERYRIKQELADYAPAVVAATLLYEDQHFYQHFGVNPVSLLRAVWSTYVSRSRVLGASTITMQLARLRYGLKTRTLQGKLMQIVRALQIERHFTKDEILAAYFNRAPYGGNVEGLGAASLIYFDKLPRDLSLIESLSLAVVAQNPTQRDPSRLDGFERMKIARARLLERWRERHSISDAGQARFLMPMRVRSTRQLPFVAPHFVRAELAANTTTGVVTTSLDLSLQAKLEGRLRDYVAAQDSRGIHNASAMLVHTPTMQVLAAVGSADFFANELAGQVDGTRAKRSPGSTLKPFVYALALDQGLIHPQSLLHDSPLRFAAYTPENYDRGFMGPIHAQDALVLSRNVPAIDLLQRVGHKNFNDFLRQGGVGQLKHADHYGLSMVLGGNELTMHELVRLYAMLANGGVVQPLRTGLENARESHRLLSPEASYLVLDMLRKNPRPGALGHDLGATRTPVAWKTGTSFAYRDAWAIGVVGPYVVATWVGNFDGSSNPAFVGRTAAAPLFFNIVDALGPFAEEESVAAEPSPGLNLRRVPLCAASGALPNRHCPQTVATWFIPGVSPIAVDEVFREIQVNPVTGRRTCATSSQASSPASESRVFQFWPTDVLAQWRRAGVSIAQPPPFDASCKFAERGDRGAAPTIRSPVANLRYQIRRVTEPDQLALNASANGDVTWLFWFVNERYIGRVEPGTPLFWQPTLGEHEVVVVDDAGRATSQSVAVSLAI